MIIKIISTCLIGIFALAAIGGGKARAGVYPMRFEDECPIKSADGVELECLLLTKYQGTGKRVFLARAKSDEPELRYFLATNEKIEFIAIGPREVINSYPPRNSIFAMPLLPPPTLMRHSHSRKAMEAADKRIKKTNSFSISINCRPDCSFKVSRNSHTAAPTVKTYTP